MEMKFKNEHQSLSSRMEHFPVPAGLFLQKRVLAPNVTNHATHSAPGSLQGAWQEGVSRGAPPTLRPPPLVAVGSEIGIVLCSRSERTVASRAPFPGPQKAFQLCDLQCG